MSETNMRLIQRAVAGHLVALTRIASELDEIQEQLREETLFPHFVNDVADVKHTLRLVTKALGELHVEYGLHADARDPLAPSVLGPETKVIDQPVSPATPPKENP